MAPRDEWRILLERALGGTATRRRAGGDDARRPGVRGGAGARARRPAGAARARRGRRSSRRSPWPPARPRRARPASRAELGVVTLLGGFEVTADGRPLDLPPGRPSTLVKLLALAARAARRPDEAIESCGRRRRESTGRRRLRNVLNRLRASCGELVVRARRRDARAGPAREVDCGCSCDEAAEALARRSSVRRGRWPAPRSPATAASCCPATATPPGPRRRASACSRRCWTCSTCWPTTPSSAATGRGDPPARPGHRDRAPRRGALPGVRRAPAPAAPPRQRPQPRRPRRRAARLAAPAAVAAHRPPGGGDEAGGRRAGLTPQPSGPCELWICRHAGQSARRLARCSSTSSRST